MWFLRVQVKICSVNLKVKWVNTFQCHFSYFFIYDRYDIVLELIPMVSSLLRSENNLKGYEVVH